MKTIVVTGNNFSVLVKTDDDYILLQDCDLLSLKTRQKLDLSLYRTKEVPLVPDKEIRLQSLLTKNPKLQLLIDAFELE